MNRTFAQRALATGAGSLLGAAGTLAWFACTGQSAYGGPHVSRPGGVTVSQDEAPAPRPAHPTAPTVRASVATVGLPVQTVTAVSKRGDFIRLAKGTLWKVASTDQPEAALWSPDTQVVVQKSGEAQYPYRFINTEHRDTVLVRAVQ